MRYVKFSFGLYILLYNHGTLMLCIMFWIRINEPLYVMHYDIHYKQHQFLDKKKIDMWEIDLYALPFAF